MDGCCKNTTSCARNAEDHRLLKSSGFNISISSVYDAQALGSTHGTHAAATMDTGGFPGQKVELRKWCEKNMDPHRDDNDFQKMLPKIRFFKLILGCLKGSITHQIPGYPRHPSDPSSSGVSESTGILWGLRFGGEQPAEATATHGKFWWHFLRIQTFTDRQLVFVLYVFFQRLSPLFGRMFFIECTSILSKLILDQRTLRWRWREFQKMGHILLILDRCVQDDDVIISIFDQNPVSFIEFVVVVSNMLFCFKPVWGKFPFLTRLFQFRVEATTSWIVSSRDIPLC